MWYDKAKKLELQPESDGQPAIIPTQMIAHSIAAPWSPERTYEYWRDSTNLESHFEIGFDGSIAQFIGTQTRADANASANRRADGTGAVSVESASNLQHTDPWTNAQIVTFINLGVWLHQQHGLPLRMCRSWDDPGYGYHRMFSQWSIGGTACPGDARASQFKTEIFPSIVSVAGGKPPTNPTKPKISISKLITASKVNPPAAGTPVTYTGVGVVEEALAAEHLLASALVDGHFGTATVDAYRKWQQELGYTGQDADGIPGRTSLAELGARHGFTVID